MKSYPSSPLVLACLWLAFSVVHVSGFVLDPQHSTIPRHATTRLSSTEETVARLDESRIQELCDRRNFDLEGVLNMRDLASVEGSPIQPGKLFRTGRLSDATHNDTEMLLETLHLKTLIDLRSPTEWKEDEALMSPSVFGNFTSMVWKERGRNKDGCLLQLKADESPIKTRFWNRQRSRRQKDLLVNNMLVGNVLEEETDCGACGDYGAKTASSVPYQGQRKERLFVCLMTEFKYVNAVLRKVRKRDLTRALLKSPFAILSRRVRRSFKKPFEKRINDGGLPLLNELLLRYGAPGINYVLRVCADETRHPIAFYCTAGKDRTGAIAAIILGLCGVDRESIVEDYALSANVYAEMDDNEAMVGALSQRNLDPETFLGAPPHVMRNTLENLEEIYGSVEAYCNWIGFGPEEQEKLRKAVMKKPQ